MTLEQFCSILVKRWRLIITCFVVVGLGTYIGSKLMTPYYQSSVLIQVLVIDSSNNQSNYSNLLASNQLVQTEADLVTSSPVLREVVSHYPGLTEQQLASEVDVGIKTGTQLFEIDVVDPSPVRAASLVNDIAATLTRQQQQVVEQKNARAQQQIQQNIDQTSQQISDITTKISALQAGGGNQQQIALLQIQLSGLQQHYNQWQTALAQFELAQEQNRDFLQVVQSGQPASSPSRPSVLHNTGGGLLVGLLLGMLLAMLFEQLDTRVRTPEALSELLDLPILATIYRVKRANRDKMINPNGGDINAEAYRILRTNIGFAGIDKPLHSLVVTSAQQLDGKSVISANLAIFMAKTGKHTLLIDADLRHPTQHTLFGLSDDKIGLSNAILTFSMSNAPDTPHPHQSRTPTQQGVDAVTTNNLSLKPFVHPAGVPNLWIMPAGPRPLNPSELLDSKAMQRFLAVIANCDFEVVIFDTPPLLGLPDASILAAKVDGAIVVFDMTRTTRGKIKQLKIVMAQTGINVLGCVANKQQRSRKDSAYSYYEQHRSTVSTMPESEARLIGEGKTAPVDPGTSGQILDPGKHLSAPSKYDNAPQQEPEDSDSSNTQTVKLPRVRIPTTDRDMS